MADAIPIPNEERASAVAGMQFLAGQWPTYSVTSGLRVHLEDSEIMASLSRAEGLIIIGGGSATNIVGQVAVGTHADRGTSCFWRRGKESVGYLVGR